jgi:hypothetical protein
MREWAVRLLVMKHRALLKQRFSRGVARASRDKEQTYA